MTKTSRRRRTASASFHRSIPALVFISLLGLASPASTQECKDFSPTRNPYFGDLHAHTVASRDARTTFGVRADAFEAFAFAQGAELGLAPYNDAGEPTRTVTLERPLDFAAVTDHSEDLAPEFWISVQDAATSETTACVFSAFPGYAYGLRAELPNGGSARLSRHVVFGSDNVPESPVTSDEAISPYALYAELERVCTGDCSVLVIPHVTNASYGLAFEPRTDGGRGITLEEAELRARYERIVEVYETRGSSECKTDFGTDDPECRFEVLPYGNLPDQTAGVENSYVRKGLLNGLQLAEEYGLNPFRLGMIANTDSHGASVGQTEERGWMGAAGEWDAAIADRMSLEPTEFSDLGSSYGLRPVDFSPGGLTVVWAEENTRESLFAALRRREVYATSGTRPIVRFFGGGGIPADACSLDPQRTLDVAYAGGVPMGGILQPTDFDGSPSFLAIAQMDGTPLQKIQVIKGWVDTDGTAQEAIYDIAGSPDVIGTVETDTCETAGSGFSGLCAVWNDPDFDPNENAFYYARLLENPTCRWQQYFCADEGITCGGGTRDTPGYGACCEPTIAKTIQERAWTSPIWFDAAP